MPRPILALLVEPQLRRQIFIQPTLDELAQRFDVRPFEAERKPTADDAAELLVGAAACINSWGTPTFDEALLARAEGLKVIGYAAGGVKNWTTDALWARGISVSSASAAIAEQVAEFCVGAIIMSRRDAFRRADRQRHAEPGNERAAWDKTGSAELWGSTVGLVGLGHVGRRVLDLLRPFACHVIAHDPVAPPDVADVQRVSLEQLLQRSDVVSLHAPSLPATHHMIGRRELALMRDGTILLNTARGALIDESALIPELRRGRLYAVLDVTDPEPPAADSPLRSLPNVWLTPHLAGIRSGRLGAFAATDVLRHADNKPMHGAIDPTKLAQMA